MLLKNQECSKSDITYEEILIVHPVIDIAHKRIVHKLKRAVPKHSLVGVFEVLNDPVEPSVVHDLFRAALHRGGGGSLNHCRFQHSSAELDDCAWWFGRKTGLHPEMLLIFTEDENCAKKG